VLASDFHMFMNQDPEFIANWYPAICRLMESRIPLKTSEIVKRAVMVNH
jgi:hypothetical protein